MFDRDGANPIVRAAPAPAGHDTPGRGRRGRLTADHSPGPLRRVRRPPPRFRRVTVARVAPIGPRLVRVTLAGPELEGFPVPQPAASVRLLLPEESGLELPGWTGNEFLLADGRRPTIRTLTPRQVDPETGELEVEIVRHDDGAASGWAGAAAPGDEVAISGPGRGYTIDLDAPAFLVGGDETALPAIAQLLEALPPTIPVAVHVEVARPDGRIDLPDHPAMQLHWHDLPADAPPGDALVAAVVAAAPALGTRIWVAGEAAAVQRIRRHLIAERELPRAHTSIRGYWKHGRRGETDGD